MLHEGDVRGETMVRFIIKMRCDWCVVQCTEEIRCSPDAHVCFCEQGLRKTSVHVCVCVCVCVCR